MLTTQLSKKVWREPVYFIAFGFGSGLAKFAPGTWGTLAGIPVYLLIQNSTVSLYLVWVIVAFLLGVYVCDKVSRDLGVHDYAGIVWDEVVGYLLTMFMAPQGIFWVITGFILFRIFDIWKPEPIRLIDKHVKGGFGIMLDDILAAVPAWIIIQALAWILI